VHTLLTYSPYSRTLPYDDSDLLCFTLHVFALADQLPATAQQLEFYHFHIYFEVLLVSEHCHPFSLQRGVWSITALYTIFTFTRTLCLVARVWLPRISSCCTQKLFLVSYIIYFF